MFEFFRKEPSKYPPMPAVAPTNPADDRPVYSVGITADDRVTLTVGQYTTMTMEVGACAKLISMLAPAMGAAETNSNEEENV